MANSHLVVGDGPHKVLALHGWFGDKHAFGSIVPYLDTERFTYAFIDYRGYGDAKATTGAFTIDEIADDTLALANELGWGRFSLVGHSMGGKAIQRVLADAPARVTALVGIAPVPASAVPLDEQGTALFYGAADSPDNRRAIIDFTTGNRLTGVWLDGMVRNSLAISTRDAFAAYLDAWAKADFHEAIAGNTVPVLAIVGENDPALGAETVRATWLAWYPNARLEVLANAGHYPMDETPLALVSTMERFLATI
jgi:pimeloyl-ACP methyl ester carboxylesterase